MPLLQDNPTSPPSGSAIATGQCAHCHAPILAHPVRHDGQAFCCGGCVGAFVALQGLRQSCPLPVHQPVDSGKFAHLDDPAFARHAVTTHQGHSQTTLSLRGMRCASCVWVIEDLPRRLPGVIEARVDFRRGRVHLRWDADRVPLSSIAETLQSMGYDPAPLGAWKDESHQRRAERSAMTHLAVAAACAANAMLLAIAMYAGLFDEMAPEHVAIFRWSSLLVTLIAVFWPGRVFFLSAWNGIRTRAINLDGPIALALLAGAAWSTYSTIIGRGEVYFDSVSVLIFALLIGRYVQQRQQRWAADAVELLFTLTPGSARRVTPASGQGETIQSVSVLSLLPGDIVEVPPGDSLPVDGIITRGNSTIDQAFLTGESHPRDISPGDEVFAGSINLTGLIRIQSRASGTQTRVGKLMELVQDASSRRADIAKVADRVGSAFLAAMLIVAACTFIAWMPLGIGRAVESAIALLVVTCPCALGLATPLAFTITIGRAARRGILIKGGNSIQRLARGGIMFLDKTGTLTQGVMEVKQWHGSAHLRAVAAILESDSLHPVGQALAALAGQHDSIPTVTHIHHTQGAGVQGLVNGRLVKVGSYSFVADPRYPIGFVYQNAAEQGAAAGLTPVFVSVDGVISACALVGDRLRPEAPDTIRALQQQGWTCEILSGDDQNVVQKVAQSCGIASFRGNLTPEAKLEIIQSTIASQPPGRKRSVIMVGDGVNDAAALAAADVGIAVAGGAQASLAAADIYVSRPGLTPLLELFTASTRTMTVVKLALCSSVVYNVTAGTIAVTGHMSPIIAALVMPLSSMTAIAICIAMRTFPKPEQPTDRRPA